MSTLVMLGRILATSLGFCRCSVCGERFYFSRHSVNREICSWECFGELDSADFE